MAKRRKPRVPEPPGWEPPHLRRTAQALWEVPDAVPGPDPLPAATELMLPTALQYDDHAGVTEQTDMAHYFPVDMYCKHTTSVGGRVHGESVVPLRHATAYEVWGHGAGYWGASKGASSDRTQVAGWDGIPITIDKTQDVEADFPVGSLEDGSVRRAETSEMVFQTAMPQSARASGSGIGEAAPAPGSASRGIRQKKKRTASSQARPHHSLESQRHTRPSSVTSQHRSLPTPNGGAAEMRTTSSSAADTTQEHPILRSVDLSPGSTKRMTQTTRSRSRQAAHAISPFHEEHGGRVQAALNIEYPSAGLQPGIDAVRVEATARSSRSGEDIENITAALLPPQADGANQEARTGREAEDGSDVGCILQPSHVSYPQCAQAREGSVAGPAPSDVPDFIHDDCGTAPQDQSQWGPYEGTGNNPDDSEGAMGARREYHPSAYTDYGEYSPSAYGNSWNGEDYSDADMLQFMSDFYAEEAEHRYPDPSPLERSRPHRQHARASSSRATGSARSSRASHASSSIPRITVSATLAGLLNPIPGNGEKFVRPSARRM